MVCDCIKYGICNGDKQCDRDGTTGDAKYKLYNAFDNEVCGALCPAEWICCREPGHEGQHESGQGIWANARW